jgi:aspartyl protease family protein
MLNWALRTLLLVMMASSAAYALAPGGPWSHLWSREPAADGIRPATTALPRRPQVVPNELVYRRARDGHFYLDAEVNGARIRFLVDTGATYLALSPADARSAGLQPIDRDFTGRVNTANGVARVAPVTLRQVEFNQFISTDVPAVIAEQPMSVSLLGMSFLSRLQGYEMRNDELILRW